MSIRVKIKCQNCGEWKKIKLMNGEKRKKVCDSCIEIKNNRRRIIEI